MKKLKKFLEALAERGERYYFILVKSNNMKGTPPLTGRALTNDLCGQYVKININVNTNGFDFDFNVLTALKGWVGLAAKRPDALHNHNYRHLPP